MLGVAFVGAWAVQASGREMAADSRVGMCWLVELAELLELLDFHMV